MIGEPAIAHRPERLSMGIRTVTPFRGLFAVRDALLVELRRWVRERQLDEGGPYFLRYHVIDMSGPMDIEVGLMVPRHITGEGRVQPGILPAGKYASLIYSRYGMRGNKALIAWARENGISWDRWDDPAGDAFCCQTESYLTDYRLEPRKSKWQVELSIKIADP